MTRNWVETIVGAVVLAVAAWFLVYSYQTGGSGKGSGGYELLAKFTAIDGVPVGADVRISGIKVGQVTSLQLDPTSYLAEVRMGIASDTQVPADSTVAVKSESLLGGRYLAIAPGADEQMLSDGGEIEYTQPSVMLEDLIGQFIFSNSNQQK
jgi:phospholipid/cholesterol/gamma-HCH transport system substrate-binding protein